MLIKRIVRTGVVAFLVGGILLTAPVPHSARQRGKTSQAVFQNTAVGRGDAPCTLRANGAASVQKSPLNNYIDMKNIQQLPELPAGCEVTSLAIVLNYLDCNISKTRLADEYLPCSDEFYEGQDGRLYGPNQSKVFAGNPRTNQYGCYAPVIEKTANSYLEDCGSEYIARNISGSRAEQLYEYVLQGIPVIVWATVEMQVIDSYITWYDAQTGEKLQVPNRLHCMVLAGVEEDRLTFNDPFDAQGIVQYPKSVFEQRYLAVGEQAVVLIKSPS